jgi:hypothetical protein
MSGFLEEDIAILENKAKSLGLKFLGKLACNEWRAVRYCKK